MKLDLTELIKTFALILFGIWAVGELSPKIVPYEPVVIDTSIADKQQKIIDTQDSLLKIQSDKISRLLNQRKNIPNEVTHYTDSDLTFFADSFSAAHGLPSGAYIQADRR